MRILIAPDSFKGSLSSEEAARAMAEGILRASPSSAVDLLPIADGGEGTTEALLKAAGGVRAETRVTGPMGTPVDSFYGILSDGKTAVLEAAAACGLTQVPPDQRDPRAATSRGLGELMIAALRKKPRRLIVGIGGSATNDGGTGMLRAFGARFLDERGDGLPEGGAALIRLAKIDLSRFSFPEGETEILVASDVTNPLCGESGASAVFGPQKGATPDAVVELDAALQHFAEVCRETLGGDLSQAPGAGAAGGIGFALMAFFGAELQPGAELILEAARFPERAQNADLILTGEGRLDAQTGLGKAVLGVSRAGKRAGKPVAALAGEILGDLRNLEEEGLAAALSLAPGPMTREKMMENAGDLLAAAAERLMKLILLGARLASRGPSEPDAGD